MKTKHIAAGLLVALAAVTNAQAAHVAHLTETFYSGAVFDGFVTFNDSFDAIKSIDGLLSGGGKSSPDGLDYNTRINTIFSATLLSDGVGRAELLDGSLSLRGATVSMLFTWNYSTAPSLTFSNAGAPNDGNGNAGSFGNYLQPFWASNPNDVDRAVSGAITLLAVPEPAGYATLLAGLGLLAWAAMRRPGRAGGR